MVIQTLERMMLNIARSTPPWITSDAAKAGRQIEEFRNHDYWQMDAEMRAVFRAYKRLPPLRFFGVISRACADLAPHYRKQPRRTLPTMSAAQRKIIDRLYARTPPVDREIERAGVGQQSYALFIHPDPDDPSGDPIITPVLGYQLMCVEWASDLGPCADLRRATRVRFAIPARVAADTERDRNRVLGSASIVDLTRDSAILTLPDGNQFGLLAPDGSNPLGYVPLVGRRRAMPADRVVWIPEPAHDLRAAAVCATLGMSDLEHVVRVEAVGILHAKGAGAKKMKKEFEIEPGKILTSENEDLVVDWLKTDINQTVIGYQAMIDRCLDLVGNLRYLRKGDLSGLTGDAKEKELGGLVEERESQETDLLRLERDAFDLYCDVWNRCLPRAQKLPTDAGHELGVHYTYARTRENVLQEAQAIAVAASMGLIDVANEIADDEQISYDDAETLLNERLKKHRERIGEGVKTPGLDRLADQVAKPLTQTSGGRDVQDQAGDAAAAAGQA